MHELYELKEKLMKELEDYASQDMTAGSLEVIDKLSHAVKNICKIIEASEDEEYSSMRGYSRNDRSYNGGRTGYPYNVGSYARRKRDSMGRYSRENGYSRTDGIEGLAEDIRGMMQDLPQNVQQDAQRFIQKLEQQM